MGAHDAPREHRRGTITLAITSTAILGTLGAGRSPGHRQPHGLTGDLEACRRGEHGG
jgi:hypothetical protein